MKIKNDNWRVIVGLMGFVFLMRGIWQLYPCIATCAVFWLSVVFWRALFIFGEKYLSLKIAWSIMLLGAASNMVVTLANGGYMPVLSEKSSSIWVTATNSHKLMALADIYSGFSIGDFIIGLGVVVACAFWVGRKMEVRNERKIA